MVWKDNKNTRNYTLKSCDKLIELKRPMVMGILNATPDSFFEGSRKQTECDILDTVSQMIKEGVDIIDLGGMSTRPDAEIISEEEEINRVIGALSAIRKKYPTILISLDSYRSNVVKAAAEFKIDMVNDVSGGLLDDRMYATVAELKVPYILMHSRGDAKTMGEKTQYNSFPQDVIKELNLTISNARKSGITDIIVDPGFGFAKNIEQNYELLRKLHLFHILDCPILVGVSRKSMIYKLLKSDPEEALNGTTVLNTIALLNGAHFLRVHDVKEAKETVLMLDFYHRDANDPNFPINIR
jgi:dihydropteroate synthase